MSGVVFDGLPQLSNPERLLGLVLCGVDADSEGIFSKFFSGALSLLGRTDAQIDGLIQHYFSAV